MIKKQNKKPTREQQLAALQKAREIIKKRQEQRERDKK
jgi:hypothetical protein